MSSTDILEFKTAGVDDGTGSVLLLINGEPILETRTIDSPRRDEPAFQLVDVQELLPPRSASLLPTAEPKLVLLGVGPLGLVGDRSLWMEVRRVEKTVRWDPPINKIRTAIQRSWSFDLVSYLDSIDAAAAAVRRWEGSARKVASELKAQRDFPLGRSLGNTKHFYQLLDARASVTKRGFVSITVAGPDGVVDLEIDARERKRDELLNEIYDFDPQRYQHIGYST